MNHRREIKILWLNVSLSVYRIYFYEEFWLRYDFNTKPISCFVFTVVEEAVISVASFQNDTFILHLGAIRSEI